MPRVTLLIVLLVLLGLEYVGSSGHYYVGYTGDDTMYLSTGRALARGLGYVDLHSPERAPHQKYPPGYPCLVSLGERLWPESLTAQRGLNVAVTLSCVALVWVMLAGQPPWIRWAVTILTGSNALWAQFAATVGSEPLYSLLLVVAILVYQRGSGRWFALALGLSVAAAIYVRTVGVVLFPAVALASLSLRERSGRVLGGLTLAVLLLLPYYLGPDRLEEYRRAGLTRPTYQESQLIASRHLALNLAVPLLFWGNPWVLGEQATAGPWAWPLRLLALSGWVLLGRGILAGLRGARGERLSAWLVLGSLSIHAIYAYFDFRYYVPILPQLYWLLMQGCRAFNRRALTSLVLASALLGNLGFALLDASVTLRAATPPVLESYAWLAGHRQAGDRVTAEVPAVWLYTGLPMVHLYPRLAAQRPDAWLNSLYSRQLTWVVLAPSPETAALWEFMLKRRDRFLPAYQNPNDQLGIFRVSGDGARFQRAFALAMQGAAALEKQDWALALERSRAALELEPRDLPLARYGLALALEGSGQRAAAVQELQRLLEAYPDHPQGRELERSLAP